MSCTMILNYHLSIKRTILNDPFFALRLLVGVIFFVVFANWTGPTNQYTRATNVYYFNDKSIMLDNDIPILLVGSY